MTENGRGYQVVKVLGDHSYQLDENVLEEILLKKEVKDLPVVVVSVAGAYRGGKSFLMNFFLRYLTSPESAQKDGSWLGDDSEPLVGFNWRSGVERNTTGIVLWSEPIITSLPSGEKVAVLLMDTQGTFDSRSTVRDNSTIFALSTLISSVQIYNLSMNIQEDDLQYLQLFTMYGKMVQEQNDGGKAFQVLEFLVRDWPYPYDYPFGAEGGNRLLEERLKITQGQPQELRELRTHIRSSFEKVMCYLLPHPGLAVQKQDFKGNISGIEPNFRIHLKELVSSLFSSEKLSPKTISGQKIKAGELLKYFKTYMTLFNSDKIPNPRSIMQATAEAGLHSSISEARETYQNGMDFHCGPTKPALTISDLQDLHRLYLDAVRITFRTKKTMASKEEADSYLEKLIKELEHRLPQIEQSNLSKIQTAIKRSTEKYDEIIDKTSNHSQLCLHPLDLEAVHKKAVDEAMEHYDAHVKKISDKPDQKRIELTQIFESRYAQLKMTNDKNNRDVVKDLQSEYWEFMETRSMNPPVSDADFRHAHDSGLNKALTHFQAKRNMPNFYTNDIYKEDLVKTIMDTFTRLHEINLHKIEQEKTRQELERRNIEQEKIKAEQAAVRAEQERTAREQEIHKIQQEKEIVEQEKERIEIENERLRRERSRTRSGGFDFGGLIVKVFQTVATAYLNKQN